MTLRYTSIFLCLIFFVSCTDTGMDAPTPPTGTMDICPDLSGQSLLDCIINNYTPTQTYTYAEARDLMYGGIDIWDDGLIHTIYTDYTIQVDISGSPRHEALDKGVNTEHIFPQSMGAREEPAKSDIYHIFPCRANVNSSRGNYPFAEIDDTETEDWYYLDQKLSDIPSIDIDNYSEGTDTHWEPRESVKGDVARAVFYFYSIHNEVANVSFYQAMKNTLLTWHLLDPADDRERQRNEKIRAVQGNDNPFIVDPGLAERIVDL